MRDSLVLLVLLGSASSARQPFTTEDLWQWRTTFHPAISPDGRLVVYAEGWNDRTSNATYSNLWLVSTDGRERNRWTEGAWRDSHPRWSAEGDRVAWISDRGGVPHLMMRILASRAETRIETPGLEPIDFSWSPAGDRIAFTARVQPESRAQAWAPAALIPFLRPGRPTTQVFIVPAAGGAPVQISTSGAEWPGQPQWTPDGVAILAIRNGSGIASIRLADRALRAITQTPGQYGNLILSGDGSRVAYLFTPAKPQSYFVRHLFAMNRDGSRVRELAGALDRDPECLQWSSDARTVYFIAGDRGVTRVYAARNDGNVRQIERPPERLREFALADNGRAVAIHSSPSSAEEVLTFTVDVASQPVILAAPNEHLLAEREIASAEKLEYMSAGNPVQAWLIKPPGFDPARKYPLLVDVRDDPRAMYGVDFQLRGQILAARGYLVLCANPRGTPGYGEVFGHLLPTRFPGDDFDDLMSGVDYVISKRSADPHRLSLSGGLVAAWALGHTGRFHAAVARRPIADWLTHVATSAEGAAHAAQWMGAMPWEDPDQYVKHSPVYFAGAFQTPTLVIAGERDAGSEQIYFALQSKKIESALLRLPGGEKPGRRVMELEAELAWLGRP